MYNYSGYIESSISFIEYIRANHAPKFTTVNNTIVFNSLATFLQVAREENLKPHKVSKIQQFKQIAFISSDGEAITA